MMKKIPDNAKVVFRGLIFDVYHWDQEMFDGSTEVFEAIRRGASVSVVAIVNNKIMVNQEEQPGKDPFIAVPGGRIDEGEDPLSAIKRELVEETGYSSNDWILWFDKDASNMAKIEWMTYYFIARNCQKQSDVHLDKGEKIETKYLTLDEFIETRHTMSNRSMGLKDILEKAASSQEERQRLQELLGIINEALATNN